LTAAGTATTDSLTINLTDTNADALSDENLSITKIETVTLDTDLATSTLAAQVLKDVSLSADTGGTTTFNVVGANALSVDEITANTVDFSGSTGAITQTTNMVGTTDGTNTLTGGSGDDTLIGDTNDITNISGGAGDDNITGGTKAETINGGAGDDTINSSTGADTINGGAGDDTITLGAATQTVDAGAGDDTVNAGAHLAFGYSVVGGAGTDILNVTAAEVIGDGSVVSGFETLEAVGNFDVDFDTYSNNTFTKLVLDTSNYGTISNVRSEVIELTAVVGGTGDVELADATGSSDSITINSTSADANTQTNALTIAGVETINIVTDDTEDDGFEQDTVKIIGANTTTINLTGDKGVILSTGTFAALTTVDGSGATIGGVSTASTVAGLTIVSDLTGVGEVISYTGTNGVDTFTGHANTDETFVGGLGADHLDYLGRKGTFTGGAGADTFDIDAVTNSTYTTNYLTITDIEDGDIIDVDTIHNGTMVWTSTEIELGSSATLLNYLDNAVSNNAGNSHTKAKWFRFGGDTYMTFDQGSGTTWTDGTDFLIKMTGSHDISGLTADVADGANTFTIAIA